MSNNSGADLGFEDNLWMAANKLHWTLDSAEYKHVVLGLIFLKYVSDAFEERQRELKTLFTTESDDNIYYIRHQDFDSDEEYEAALADELEILDYYQEKNDFVLTPGRYVGAEEVEDDGIPFGEKMADLTAKLKVQFEESDHLKAEIKQNLVGLGYEF